MARQVGQDEEHVAHLVLQAVALLPVIVYWAAQTVEYWGGGSDRYRPAPSSG